MTKKDGHIFISYSRRDSEAMHRVRSRLEQNKYEIWVDEEGLQPGTGSWVASIEDAIEDASSIVCILSPHAKESKWVRLELTYAEQFNLKIFPILVSGNERTAIPLTLIETQYADASGDFAAGIQRLIDGLDSSYGRRSHPSDAFLKGSAVTFINYRRLDMAMEAKLIYQKVQSNFAHQPFFDVDIIPVGVNFTEFIPMAVANCKTHLLLIGSQWLIGAKGNRRLDDPNDFVRIEAEAALAANIPLISVIGQGARLPQEDELPASLAEVAYSYDLPLRLDSAERDLTRLMKVIEWFSK